MTYDQMTDKQKKAVEPWVERLSLTIFHDKRDCMGGSPVTFGDCRNIAETRVAEIITAFLGACPTEDMYMFNGVPAHGDTLFASHRATVRIVKDNP